MTKRTKDAHLSDSASGGKGESMTREIRIECALKWVRSDEGRAAYLLAYNKTAHLSSPHPWVPNLLAAYAESECSRLASRVEELEKALKPFAKFAELIERDELDDMHGIFFSVRFGDARNAAKLLAGAHAEEKE